MKRKFIKYTRGGVLVPLSLLFVNAAFADATSDRLDAYKSNKLIPENITFTTPATGGTNDTAVVFTKSSLSWNFGNAVASYNKELLDKFASLSKEELENWEWLGLDNENFIDLTGANPNQVYGWKGGYNSDIPRNPDNAEFLDYLWKIQTGEITDANITAEEAKALKVKGFQQIANNVITSDVDFKFDGTEDLSGSDIFFSNILESCSGITGAQIASMSRFENSALTNVTFSGTEDLTGLRFGGGNSYVDLDTCPGLTFQQLSAISASVRGTLQGNEDFSGMDLSSLNLGKLNGMTVSQVMSASKLPSVLPSLTFSGNEDFTGREGTDFGNCTGITAQQIMSMSKPPKVLPNTKFTGSEDISSWYIGNTDFSRATGITSEQLASSASVTGVTLSQEQYDALKAYVASDSSWKKGRMVYIRNADGSRTSKKL